MNPAIIDELAALQAHFPRVNREPAEQERWLRDYMDDLGGLSVEAIRHACREWRRSGARSFPKSGELVRVAERHLAPATDQSVLPTWRPLTDAEYDALTLSAKVRHQLILAHEAEMKAGPQMIRGVPVAADRMHPAWSAWKTRAANHRAEAQRLRAKLTDATEMYHRREAFV